MSLSPKLSSSAPPQSSGWAERHAQRRVAAEVIRRLAAEYPYQCKFVVDSLEDCQEVEQYLASIAEIDRSRVMLMPEGRDAATLAARAQWLEPYCAEHGLIYCRRRQIEWFGPQRGT